MGIINEIKYIRLFQCSLSVFHSFFFFLLSMAIKKQKNAKNVASHCSYIQSNPQQQLYRPYIFKQKIVHRAGQCLALQTDTGAASRSRWEPALGPLICLCAQHHAYNIAVT